MPGVTVRFWSYAKDPRSTARPAVSDAAQYTCIINSDCDIMTPRLPIQDLASAPSYNYAYVTQFGMRCYWIDRWVYEQGLWTAYCHVDVLATYKSAITGSSQYVLRAASDSDGSIVDTMYPATMAVTRSVNTATTLWDANAANGSYIITVVGADGIKAYELSRARLDAVMDYLFSDNFLQAVDVNNVLGELGKGFIDPSDYIRGCFYNPVNLDIPSGAGPWKMGWWTFSDASMAAVGIPLGYTVALTRTITVPKHPQAATRGSYLNCAPYASYDLEVQPFGKFSLDPAKLQGVSTLTLTVEFDAYTGDSILKVTAGSTCVALATGNPTVPVALTQLRTGAGPVIGGAVGGAVGEAAGGKLGKAIGAIIGGAAGTIAQVATGISSGSIVPEPTIIGTNGAWAGLYSAPAIYGTFLSVVDEDPAHHGRPLCQMRTLSTMSGYVLCENPHVAITGTAAEAEEIEAALAAGVLIE